MKHTTILIGIALLAGAVVFPAACQKKTLEGPGGKQIVAYTPRDMEIHRGSRKILEVQLVRRNTRREVKVSISQLPEGVTAVHPTQSVETDSVSFILQASDEAALVTDHKVAITIEGPDEMQGTEYVSLTVLE